MRRKYVVVKCSCGEENVLPHWSKDGKEFLLKVTEDPNLISCGNPECGAELEIFIRHITEKELDNLKACMSLCGSKKEVDDLTI